MMPSLTGTRAVSAQMSRSSAFTASALGIGQKPLCIVSPSEARVARGVDTLGLVG